MTEVKNIMNHKGNKCINGKLVLIGQTLETDKSIGDIVFDGSTLRYISTSEYLKLATKNSNINDFDKWKIYKPVVVSESEVFSVGDLVVSGGEMFQYTSDTDSEMTCFKVIVLSEEFLREHKQAIVDGYLHSGGDVIVGVNKSIIKTPLALYKTDDSCCSVLPDGCNTEEPVTYNEKDMKTAYALGRADCASSFLSGDWTTNINKLLK